MKKHPPNSDQLCFSIGRPLAVLLEEIQKTSRQQELRKAAAQMLEGLHTLQLADQTGISKSPKTKEAIYEILTK